MAARRTGAPAGWSPAPPAGPRSTMTRARQPGASLPWLQRAHLPEPSSYLVAPPSRAGVVWSACAIGASHHGVVHTSSRSTSIRRSNPPNSRRRESMPTRSRPSGEVYNRRTHTRAAPPSRAAGGWARCRPFAQPSPRDRGRDAAVAGDPGRFDHRPVRVAGAEQGPVGHHQVHLHRLQLTRRPPGQQLPARCPPRPHPPHALRPLLDALPDTTARDLACTAAYAPTTSLSGPSTLRYAIPSGAGRTVTRRDRTAASIRRHHRRRVQLGRDPRRRRTRLLDPEPAQQRTHPGIHHSPVLHRSVGRRRHDRDRDPLTTLPRDQCRHRVRHLVHQRPRQPHEPVPQRRRLPPRQRHHRPHRPRHVLRRHHLAANTPPHPWPEPEPPTPPPSPAPAPPTRSTRSRSVNTGRIHARQPHPEPSTTPAGTTPPPAGTQRGALTASGSAPNRPGTAEPGSTTRPTTTSPSMR